MNLHTRRTVAFVALLLTALGCGGDVADRLERAADALGGPAPSRKGGRGGARKASKGEVQVTTGAAVVVYVDGAPVTFDMAEGYVQRLTPGQHQMEVVNALGKTVATETITISAGQRTRYQCRTGGRLDGLGTTSMPERAVAAPVAAPLAAPAGSLQIDGLDSGGHVWVDGRAATWTQWDGFVAKNLASGGHDLRVESYGSVIYEGGIDVSAGQNRGCLLATDA